MTHPQRWLNSVSIHASAGLTAGERLSCALRCPYRCRYCTLHDAHALLSPPLSDNSDETMPMDGAPSNFGVKLPRPGFGPAAELPLSSPA
jgi:hypothetical protein